MVGRLAGDASSQLDAGQPWSGVMGGSGFIIPEQAKSPTWLGSGSSF